MSLVSPPIEIRSTPVSAIARTFASVSFSPAPRRPLGATISTGGALETRLKNENGARFPVPSAATVDTHPIGRGTTAPTISPYASAPAARSTLVQAAIPPCYAPTRSYRTAARPLAPVGAADHAPVKAIHPPRPPRRRTSSSGSLSIRSPSPQSASVIGRGTSSPYDAPANAVIEWAIATRIDLGGGLLLRAATADDRERLVAFNGRVFDDPGEPEPVMAWTRDFFESPPPGFRPSDFTVVEDTATGRIVSALRRREGRGNTT